MSQRSNATPRSKPSRKNRQNGFMLPKNIPAYPGQVCKQFDIPLTPVLATSVVTTGLVSVRMDVFANLISNFTTRFGSLFEEYRIVKVLVSWKNFSSTNNGLITHWIDEKDNSAPTLAEAQQKSDKQFSASSPSPHTISWVARDPLDLQYTDISTVATTVCTYKAYSNAANFGTSIVATPYGQVTGRIWIQFRGLN
jgi:hypothetical protein